MQHTQYNIHIQYDRCKKEDCVTLFWFSLFSELQSQLQLTLKEKNQAVADLEAVRDELRETREEVSSQIFLAGFYAVTSMPCTILLLLPLLWSFTAVGIHVSCITLIYLIVAVSQ